MVDLEAERDRRAHCSSLVRFSDHHTRKGYRRWQVILVMGVYRFFSFWFRAHQHTHLRTLAYNESNKTQNGIGLAVRCPQARVPPKFLLLQDQRSLRREDLANLTKGTPRVSSDE